MSSNQRAMRLAIAGLMIVFGLISLSQAGFFVIRYLTLSEPLSPDSQAIFTSSALRSYWLLFGAGLIQFTLKQIVEKKLLLMWLIFSLIGSFMMLITWM